ncbi:DNA mismatch repair endonuclease MutL [Planctomicrobium sp. SH527]|uniref:DNA mismatch repair endonuclease MutL n=1 Tax=Planctomicrobium sp. SH527 TaxID=3448123 RepID=UPI003F5BDBDC
MPTDDAFRIRQLSTSVINKIAAGEVIERPASVVKELLENSVDALSTKIDVDIEQGGSELIRITDNGEGVHPDDILLTVAAHATSKLASADDLFSIKTMGFRGEALASIAEVSQFRLRSKQREQTLGYELEVDAGEIKEPRACGCPDGTQIEVRQLFCNTPVRRKFLKAASTEFGHIAEQFTRIALANPLMQMTLRHNGRTVHELPPSSQLLERIELFFGSELASQLISVEAENNGIRVWGYVGHPSQSKSTRKGQYLFLNGRWIQDRSLQHALGEAYRGLIMIGRYPVSFLFLELPADMVDVNVHPTKSEVRFQDSQSLFRLLLSSIRNRFLTMDLDSRLTIGSKPSDRSAVPQLSPPPGIEETFRQIPAAQAREIQPELVSWAKNELEQQQELLKQSPDAASRINPSSPLNGGFSSGSTSSSFEDEIDRMMTGSSGQESRSFEPNQFASLGQTSLENRPQGQHSYEEYSSGDQSPSLTTPANPEPFSSEPFSSAPLPQATVAPKVAYANTQEASITPASANAEVRAMQVHDCYLVVETTTGITVIDQHALHERIMYEQLRRRVLAGSVEIQRLLLPLTVQMTAREASALLDQTELLEELGLHIQDFGGNTIAMTGYPTLMAKADPQALLRDIVDLLETSGRKIERRDLLDKMLHMMSCKAAIKAGQRLSPEEMEALLAQRHLCDDAHHCPHGRPTALNLTREELDRQFGRLGS